MPSGRSHISSRKRETSFSYQTPPQILIPHANMPSVTYMNQSAPFWDFLASLEQQGNSHPFFSQHHNGDNEPSQENKESHEEPAFGPWGVGANFFGGRGMPHRGPPGSTNPFKSTAAPDLEADGAEPGKEKREESHDEMKDNGEGPSGNSGSDNEGCAGSRDRQDRYCGGPRHRGPPGPGRWNGPFGHCRPQHGSFRRAGPHHGPYDQANQANQQCRPGGPHNPHHGTGGHGSRGGWGPWGGAGLFDNAGFDPATLATHFWNQFTDNNTNTNQTKDNEDLIPDADIFDTESAYVIHISLPGAKKEDVGVNWDAEKSELSVAGVIYRPGDEEFLKTLAMNERKVGPFERKLRLGTRASPAHIDADGITAKLEDGILRVEVPKLDTGYVEIRKVDIE
ncbi:hypothetical protein HBI56_159100 [Parastagonospora nodorum]|nr:hypothetical protein HBI10_183120 [Parastagonospora nodorum]KAH4014032.1 hypothetical protein HBI13_175220 [Parastagonospora nodorum]KAH4021959.1 hypothetical protein HBI09_174400 [Parastagonospora nodorum]KAH4093612.1 hypothetical protein HBH46_177070 [Parastagonospora nodorum]KAH4207333.1 hypothetical protein HBI95_115440 [Parastagonospora nodorum]